MLHRSFFCRSSTGRHFICCWLFKMECFFFCYCNGCICYFAADYVIVAVVVAVGLNGWNVWRTLIYAVVEC